MNFLELTAGNILFHFNIGSIPQINHTSVLVIETLKWIKVEQYFWI